MRLLIVILALAVGLAGMDVDAKKRKTRSRKRAARTKVVEPAPTGYDYVQGSTDIEIIDLPKYPPEYPGGTQGLVQFLGENIKYPKAAERNGVQGTVVLQFVVEKSGSISNITVLKSVSRELDAEAVRVVSQIKRFVPGYDEDHAPVRTLFTLPVKFSLE